MRIIPCITAAVLMALSLFETAAQQRVWNDALDRYEYVCLRCQQWKQDIAAGRDVPRDSLNIMLKELEIVRRNLLYTLEDMSPGQRRRFEAIRDRFATGEWPAKDTVELARHDFPATVEPIAETIPIKTGEEKIERRAPHVSALAGIVSSIYPDLSAGFAAGVTVGKWAVFLQARSNFRWQKSAYECFSDGTADSGFFWSGEGRRVNRHNITLDVSYAVWEPVSVYAGAGYGVRTLCWEDYEGNWAKVADRSYGSAAVDAGLLIHPFRKEPVRGLTFLVGGTWIHKNWFEAGLGLLWRF